MGDDYSVASARTAARGDELAGWVKRFLASPGSDNPELAEKLWRADRQWAGPVEVPIDRLHRLAGPAGAPVLEVVDDDEWRDDVDELADQVKEGRQLPPVIVTFRDDGLMVEDGNHRIEAIRRAGRTEAWAVIGFDDVEQLDRFMSAMPTS